MGINKMFYPSLLIQKLFVNLRCISLLLLDKGVAKICNKFKKEQINPVLPSHRNSKSIDWFLYDGNKGT